MAEKEQVAFKIAVQRRKEPTIAFDLGGEVYHFTPPKESAEMMALESLDLDAIAQGLRLGDDIDPMNPDHLDIIAAGVNHKKHAYDWLEVGLPAEEAQRIEERLRDQTDGLKPKHLDEAMTKLQEAIAGRPTQASSGS